MSTMESDPPSVQGHELRRTRIASPNTLFLGTALLAQLMVLSAVAVIMGVAVLAMGTLLVELVVLAVVATALERRLVSLEDLGTLMEIAATVLITLLTILLAAVGGRSGSGPLHDPHASLAARKFG